MRQRLLHRFYGAILLLNTLGPVRGDRQKADLVSDEPGVHDTKLRHHFRNALAYICAFDTGSDHVTAIALDAQPSITNVLIAANRGVTDEVVEFLRDILSMLHRIALDSPVQDTSHVQDAILRKVTRLGQPRIRYYHQVAVDMYESCLEIMPKRQDIILQNVSESDRYIVAKSSASPFPTELDRLRAFLDRYFSPGRPLEDEDDCLALVKQCHSIRASGMIESLDSFAVNGQRCQSKFQRLQELLKKLGKHVTCSRRLVNAANSLPDEFALGFEVKPISPSTPLPIGLPLKKSSVEAIVGLMTSDPPLREAIKEQLKGPYLGGLDTITQKINETLRSAKTQTHAELLLINYMEQHEEISKTNNNYIGCSKPACYLCHLYIRHHPGKYSLPDTSNKLYVKWRIPDIDPGNKDAISKLNEQAEKILEKIIQDIKTDFMNDLARSKPRNMHADSSADMTTTVAGPDVGDGASAGLQPLGFSSYFESLALNDPPSIQEATPTFNTLNINQDPFSQHQQPYLPLYIYPASQIEYSNPHLPRPFHPTPLMAFASPIPGTLPTSAAFSHAHIPTPSFPYNRRRDNDINSNNSGSGSSSGNRTIFLLTNNTTGFNNGQEQQAPSSQGAGGKPKWPGPPSRRWGSR
ncbi:hypothetical protein GX51_02329 [Blastomyces parvus]|uniref:Uncharacterized protein n=1 Tax=Blastomyces parvus TaxID=2060905 RepID=A0A2B7XC00_9EURO|nr:hypothetical protein GX51_02329 [Blastomyces parvus]